MLIRVFISEFDLLKIIAGYSTFLLLVKPQHMVNLVSGIVTRLCV